MHLLLLYIPSLTWFIHSFIHVCMYVHLSSSSSSRSTVYRSSCSSGSYCIFSRFLPLPHPPFAHLSFLLPTSHAQAHSAAVTRVVTTGEQLLAALKDATVVRIFEGKKRGGGPPGQRINAIKRDILSPSMISLSLCQTPLRYSHLAHSH